MILLQSSRNEPKQLCSVAQLFCIISILESKCSPTPRLKRVRVLGFSFEECSTYTIHSTV